LVSLRKNYRICKLVTRQSDKDRYLSALFAPKDRRRYLFVISAFNYEVAQIRDRISEPMMGELRLQWWRDAVESRSPSDTSRGPVANALVDTISQFNLPRARFQELIDARTFDLYADPMPTLAQFEIYLDSTSSSLMQFAARILDQTETREIDETALHAGRAYAITGLLRNFAHHASRGQVYVPQDLLSRHGATRDDIISGQATEGVRASLREMRDLARFHLMEARKRMILLPKTVLPAFLAVEMVPNYLARMESPDYDPFRTQILTQFIRPWAIWRSARRLNSHH
jgi:phytoene synthase